MPDHSVHEAHDAHAYPSKERSTAVLDVRGLRWASQQSTVTAVPGRRPGVLDVEANPVAQTATVVFDPRRTTPAELRRRVEECGYHGAGQSVPAHVCDPMAEPDPLALEAAPAEHAAEPHAHEAHEHEAHEHEADIREPGAAAEHAAPEHEEGMPSPHDMMGHGGHGGMWMAAMVADMRGRFLVARLFSVPVVIWSPIGRDVFKLDIPVPFGLREDVWALLLSLPVVFIGALPIAAGVFEPAFGLVLRPEIAALSMSHSSFVVAVNALSLKGLRLPSAAPSPAPAPPGTHRPQQRRARPAHSLVHRKGSAPMSSTPHPRRTASLVSAAAAALLLATACTSGNGSSTATSTATAPSPASSATTAGAPQITMKNFAFSPTTLTVKAGQKVTVANDDSTAHTVTAAQGKTFDTGNVAPGKTGTFTAPAKSGSYPFVCTYHANMKGTLIVR